MFKEVEIEEKVEVLFITKPEHHDDLERLFVGILKENLLAFKMMKCDELDNTLIKLKVNKSDKELLTGYMHEAAALLETELEQRQADEDYRIMNNVGDTFISSEVHLGDTSFNMMEVQDD